MSSGTTTGRQRDVLRPGQPLAAAPGSYDRAPYVALWVAGLGLGLIVGIELTTRTDLSGPGALALELSRWCALLGTYGALLVVVLVARVPWLERSVGYDRMVAYHRRLGPAVIALIGAHVVLVTIGYAAGQVSFLEQAWAFLTTYTWMLPAFVGLVLMLMAGATSWRVARRRMKYETWWVTHLYLYLAIALAFMHQVLFGQQLAAHDWARWTWIGMYAVTFGSLVGFRIWLPVYRSLRHDLRVHAVVRESDDTISVWLRGRDLDALRIRGGQFFGWRFLTPQMWWDSHPYSLSAGADSRYLRITVKDLGDHSRSLARLRPGTRVVAEGPYGVFTADRRHSERVVLLAGGTGVAPIRALLDDLPTTVRVDLLFRAPRTEALVLRGELEAIAAVRRNLRVRYLVGNRRAYPIDARTLLYLVPDIASADIYVCGPRELTDAVRTAADVLGIPARHVHDEAFSFQSPDSYSLREDAR